MNYQDAMLIASKKMTVQQLIVICINDCASKLYPYMQFLKAHNRGSECAVIEGYRQQLFDCRDRASKSSDFKDSIKTSLPLLLPMVSQIKLHRLLLGGNKQQAWELDLFSLSDNDIMGFMMIISDYAYDRMLLE